MKTIRLKAGKERSLQRQHPWIFESAIAKGSADAGETVRVESHEEIGIDTHLVAELETFSDIHGNWRYDTVIAHAHPDLVAHEQNDESLQIAWVEISEVVEKNLHPSFAKTWPELEALLRKLLV